MWTSPRRAIHRQHPRLVRLRRFQQSPDRPPQPLLPTVRRLLVAPAPRGSQRPDRPSDARVPSPEQWQLAQFHHRSAALIRRQGVDQVHRRVGPSVQHLVQLRLELRKLVMLSHNYKINRTSTSLSNHTRARLCPNARVVKSPVVIVGLHSADSGLLRCLNFREQQ